MAQTPDISCGPFELQALVGRGATGEVWRGRHRDHGTEAAIKVLDPEALDAHGGNEGFRRSVQAQARLEHPGIARIFDYGWVSPRHTDRSDGLLPADAPWMAQELAHKGTLADALLPSDWGSCREILLGVLDALAHAHARDIVHRDLKPANVLRFPRAGVRGRWRLTDFGFAVHFPRDGDGPTSAAAPTAGTPEYMAPEQIEGRVRSFGPWTDLYQVGCMSYEFVCGRPPYIGDTFQEVVAAHLNPAVPDVEPRLEVPEGTIDWLHTLLAADPAERYRRAAEAARALVELEPTDGNTHVFSSPVDSPLPDRRPARMLAELWRIDRPAAPGDLPFPADWEKTDIDPGPPVMPEAGLDLIGLREIPFVGRRPERDAMWSRLRDVVQGDGVQMVLIEGAAGLGRSRLAAWHARRAHELGVANLLHATHGPEGGRSHGLRGMVERWLQSWNADRSECETLVRRRLAWLARPEPPQQRHDLAAGLTELIRPTPDSATPEGSSPYHLGLAADRYNLVGRLIDHLSRERPLVLTVENLHHGPQTVAFLEWFLESRSDLPVFVVATAAPSEGAPRSRVDTLLETSRGRRLELAPLSPADQRELLIRIFPLTRAPLEAAIERAEGRPGFAIRLVEDWALRGLLEPGDSGYRFRGEPPEHTPDSLVELWNSRVDSALTSVPNDQRDEAMEALELAAALGRHVDQDELVGALDRRGLNFPRAWLERELVDRGLISREAGGWTFCHDSLVETLRRRARQNRRLRQGHRVVADVLGELYSLRADGVQERRADHLEAAGDVEGALEALYDAAREARRDSGLFDRAAELLERRRRLLDAHDLPEDDPRRLENSVETAWCLLHRGQPSAAEGLARRARRMGADADLHRLKAEAALVLARLARDRGALEANADCVRAAEDAFRRADDERGLLRCLRIRAQLLRQSGRPDDSRSVFKQARRLYRATDDPLGALWCTWGIACTLLQQGHHTRAESATRRLIERADARNARRLQASAWNLLGEVARSRHDWDEAVDAYEEARRLWTWAGSRDRLLAELNLALTHLGARDIPRAARNFGQLIDEFVASGWSARELYARLGLAVCQTATGHWDELPDNLDRLDTLARKHGFREPEMVELAETAAAHAAEAERDAQSWQFQQLADLLRSPDE